MVTLVVCIKWPFVTLLPHSVYITAAGKGEGVFIEHLPKLGGVASSQPPWEVGGVFHFTDEETEAQKVRYLASGG